MSERTTKRASTLRMALQAVERLLRLGFVEDAREIIDDTLAWLSSDTEHENAEHIAQNAGIAMGIRANELVSVGYHNGAFQTKLVRRTH